MAVVIDGCVFVYMCREDNAELGSSSSGQGVGQGGQAFSERGSACMAGVTVDHARRFHVTHRTLRVCAFGLRKRILRERSRVPESSCDPPTQVS